MHGAPVRHCVQEGRCLPPAQTVTLLSARELQHGQPSAVLWSGLGVRPLGAVPGTERERRPVFRAGMKMEMFWLCSAAHSVTHPDRSPPWLFTLL